MKNKKILIPLLVISFLCFGCNEKYNSYVTINITNAPKNGKIIKPNDVQITETYYTLESKLFYNRQVLPSIGDVKLLVIPILLSDYKTIDLDGDMIDDKEKVRKDLNEVFFADKNEKYESVKSFYKKSSFNKLNLSGIVTEWFDVAKYTSYTSSATIDFEQTFDVVDAAVKWVKETQKIDFSQYDVDSDGYIDGVWCVYSAPNYTNGGPQTDNTNYWAYTTWGNQSIEDGAEQPNVLNPVYNLFGWASYDFMYNRYGIEYIDAHTYIHETGHFLGLNDYYSDQLSYNPLGKIDMMDGNISDHNSYSKMLLGWTKPYIVTGNTKIDLYASGNENSFIIIPGDSQEIKNNEFDPFGEYILIELYTNDGLNEKDSLVKNASFLKGLTSKGVKIYHIDNRKFIVDVTESYNIYCKEYEGETLTNKRKIVLPITNNRGLDEYNVNFNLDFNINLYDEIRLIESSNIDTFTAGGIQKEEGTLFKKGDIFSLAKYGEKFFLNKQKFNNGDTFSYHIEIEEVK